MHVDVEAPHTGWEAIRQAVIRLLEARSALRERPFSVAELRLGEHEVVWLRRWAENVDGPVVDLLRETPDACAFEQPEAWTRQEAFGLLTLTLAAEVVRRDGDAHEVWPPVVAAFSSSVRRSLFDAAGQPRPELKRALEEGAERFGLRHAFGAQAVRQPWYRTVMLQVGFTRQQLTTTARAWFGGIARLPDALDQLLLPHQGSPSLIATWTTLQKLATGCCSKADARPLLQNSAWVLPDWVDELLAVLGAPPSRTPPQARATPAPAPPTDRLVEEPRLRWPPGQTPHFVARAVHPARLGFEGRRARTSSEVADVSWLRQGGVLVAQGGDALRLPPSLVARVTLIDDHDELLYEQHVTTVAIDQGVAVFTDDDTSRPVALEGPVPPKVESLLLVVRAGLDVEPRGLNRYAPPTGQLHVFRIPVVRLGEVRVRYGDSVLWSGGDVGMRLSDAPTELPPLRVELFATPRPRTARPGPAAQWAHEHERALVGDRALLKLRAPDGWQPTSVLVDGLPFPAVQVVRRGGGRRPPTPFSARELNLEVTLPEPVRFSPGPVQRYSIAAPCRRCDYQRRLWAEATAKVVGASWWARGGWRTVTPDTPWVIDGVSRNAAFRFLGADPAKGTSVQLLEGLAPAVPLGQGQAGAGSLKALRGLGERLDVEWTPASPEPGEAPRSRFPLVPAVIDRGSISDVLAVDGEHVDVVIALEQADAAPFDERHAVVLWSPPAAPRVTWGPAPTDVVPLPGADTPDGRPRWRVAWRADVHGPCSGVVATAYRGRRSGLFVSEAVEALLRSACDRAALEGTTAILKLAALVRWLRPPVLWGPVEKAVVHLALIGGPPVLRAWCEWTAEEAQRQLPLGLTLSAEAERAWREALGRLAGALCTHARIESELDRRRADLGRAIRLRLGTIP